MACVLLGGCTTGSARDADDQFQSGSDRAPTAWTLYNAARLLADQGRDDEAVWVFQRINRDYPSFAPAYCALAECHMRNNRNSEAVVVLQQGLIKLPNDPVIINNLGMCAMVKGEYDQALSHFTKAAALSPGNVRYRANMAAALGRMERYDEALAIYSQVLEPWDAHYNVGVLAEACNDRARADEEFATAHRLEQADRERRDRSSGERLTGSSAVPNTTARPVTQVKPAEASPSQ
jgi:Flp pilus assembly protein TadD